MGSSFFSIDDNDTTWYYVVIVKNERMFKLHGTTKSHG